ncbi:MAG: serine/threonine protein kinase [Acidobacteria bacterium]|nr:serine/threonine protein kinase [Acidobacteriota bacterium]
MTPQQRWQRVRQLAEQAEALGPLEREAFLVASEPDVSIRTEVLFLVAGLEQEPQAEPLQKVLNQASTPDFIGPYRITGILGQGGMGIVYSADLEAGGKLQAVAIKLIRTQWSDAKQAIRFAREQKILSTLDHPGITKLIDTGVTADNQPYLVMERVDGQALDLCCDQNRLSLNDRIRLLVDICRAVDGAHRNLVVHLDLKPSNILVTKSGQVKLLDSGTAKLLHPDSDLTTTRQLTPMYASPEQLRGEPVSTACDIYSIGLILYEQLSGSWPFGSRDSMMSVAARAMGTTDTQSLSKEITEDNAQRRGLTVGRLKDRLRGDLEAIVRKALAPHAKDRYGSVNALADDLDNFLSNRPVSARRNTTLYRVKKYALRNRGALGVTTILIVGLLSSAGYAFWQQRRAMEAGRRAQVTAQFLQWMIQTSNPINGGSSTRTVRDMIEQARPRIEKGLQEFPEVFVPLTATFGDFLVSASRPESGIDWLKRSVNRSRELNSPVALLNALAPYVTTLSNNGKCPEAIAVEKEMKLLLNKLEPELSPVERVNINKAIAYPEEACELNSSASLISMEKAYAASKQIPNDTLATDYPARLFKGVLAVNYAASLRNADRLVEARSILSEALGLISAEPDSSPVRVALLCIRSTIEAEELNYMVSAESLREIIKLAGDGLAPLDLVRLHSVLAIRLASAQRYPEAIQEASLTSSITESRIAELGATAHIPFVDLAVASALAENCDSSLKFSARAYQLSGNQIGSEHLTNYEAARGVCLVRTGSKAEGLALVLSIIEKQKIAQNPSRPLAKALRAAEALARQP